METSVVERDGVVFVACAAPVARVDDALDLVNTCIEHGACGVLLESGSLPAVFFDLRSRFAGEFLQKLVNYRIRVAAVIPGAEAYGERFAEFVAEARRGRDFRTFDEREPAASWLCSA